MATPKLFVYLDVDFPPIAVPKFPPVWHGLSFADVVKVSPDNKERDDFRASSFHQFESGYAFAAEFVRAKRHRRAARAADAVNVGEDGSKVIHIDEVPLTGPGFGMVLRGGFFGDKEGSVRSIGYI